ncbi:MAG: hypothetical protein ABDH21_00270 [bacterium]
MTRINSLNNLVYSTKIHGSVNLRSEVEFPKDKIINAQILEKNEKGEAKLKIGKYTVNAKIPPDVYLRPGDSFKLQVLGKEKDVWNFKFISINRSSIFYKISPEEINSHLIRHKLPVDDNSSEIIKALFKYGLELSVENYSALLPYSTSGSKLYLEAAAFLKSINIPVNPQNVKIFYEFLSNNLFLANILLTINQNLSSNPSINPIIQGIIQTFVANILKNNDKNAPERIRNINDINSKKINKIINFLDKEIPNLPDSNLKKNLEKLLDIMKAIKIINESLQEERTYFNVVPAIINGYPTTVEIKIFYYVDKETKKVEKDRFGFEITVNAPRIGPVTISASVVQNNVSTHIKKSTLPEEIFMENKQILENLLKEKGYKLGNMIVKYVSEINLEEGVNVIA